MRFLEVFFVKSEIASERLSFLRKRGLEFFSAGLEFFWKRTKKEPAISGRFQFTWANCDAEPSGPPTLLPTRSAGNRRNPCQRGQSQRMPQRLETAVSGVELDSGVATASRLGTRLELGRTQQAGAQQVWTLSPYFFFDLSPSLGVTLSLVVWTKVLYG